MTTKRVITGNTDAYTQEQKHTHMSSKTPTDKKGPGSRLHSSVNVNQRYKERK